MYRRRPRRPREIAFSLDSFLDLVANVVGIIVRLILVAWVGARSYKAIVALPVPADAPTATTAPKADDDPARRELDLQRKELQDTQDRLLAQLRRLQDVQGGNEQAGKQLVVLSARHQDLEKERGALDRALTEQTRSTVAVSASLEDLRKRRARLEEEIKALEKLPSAKRVLRYRTPVSRPVHTEELHFECRDGRVTFVDVEAFHLELRAWFQDKSHEPAFQWPSEGFTRPVGVFRVHFFLELQPRASLDRWVVEPITVQRGEPGDAALVPGSAFRQVADAIDPDVSVVTFWVYADSFPLYRRLRDYLYARGVEVAGRPMMIGDPIGFSPNGSVSRGQ